jgi:hypothetical protein
MYLNVPQVNDIIYCDGCASDSSSQGVLFSIASIILILSLMILGRDCHTFQTAKLQRHPSLAVKISIMDYA